MQGAEPARPAWNGLNFNQGIAFGFILRSAWAGSGGCFWHGSIGISDFLFLSFGLPPFLWAEGREEPLALQAALRT